ncbi:hypothetical protein VTI28DRAFT_178 [Corynascus sepedonium]
MTGRPIVASHDLPSLHLHFHQPQPRRHFQSGRFNAQQSLQLLPCRRSRPDVSTSNLATCTVPGWRVHQASRGPGMALARRREYEQPAATLGMMNSLQNGSQWVSG